MYEVHPINMITGAFSVQPLFGNASAPGSLDALTSGEIFLALGEE